MKGVPTWIVLRSFPITASTLGSSVWKSFNCYEAESKQMMVTNCIMKFLETPLKRYAMSTVCWNRCCAMLDRIAFGRLLSTSSCCNSTVLNLSRTCCIICVLRVSGSPFLLAYRETLCEVSLYDEYKTCHDKKKMCCGVILNWNKTDKVFLFWGIFIHITKFLCPYLSNT